MKTILIYHLRIVLIRFIVPIFRQITGRPYEGDHNMYVCICNPFTDKDVKSALEDPCVKNTPAQIYKTCSGGNGPHCGSCMNMVKNLIVDHQSAIGVQRLIEDLPEIAASPR